MKPLEPTVYPVCDCGPPEHYIDCNRLATAAWLADLWSEEKRFTDAELAAEYWHAVAQYETSKLPGWKRIARLEHEYLTLGRFATTPSYDE